MTKASDSPSTMTAKEHAALHLKVPQSGTEWLDQMIRAARDLDAEQFKAKLQEPAKTPKPKAPRKEPEFRDQKD